MVRWEKGADKEPYLLRGAAMQFCTLLQMTCGEVKWIDWSERGQGSPWQTQTSVSQVRPGGLALASASLDPTRYISGTVNKTQVAGGETECKASYGDLGTAILPSLLTAALHRCTRSRLLSLFPAAFPRMCFLASSYGQGALESALRHK